MKSQLSLFALLLGLVSGAYAGDAKEAPKAAEQTKVETPAPAAEEKKADEPKAEEKKEEKGILAKLFSKDDKKEEEKKAEEPKAEEKKEEGKKPEQNAGIALPTESVGSANVAPVPPASAATPASADAPVSADAPASAEVPANAQAPASAEAPKA